MKATHTLYLLFITLLCVAVSQLAMIREVMI